MSNGSNYVVIENRTGQTLYVALDTRYSGFFYGYHEGATWMEEVPPSEYLEKEGKYMGTLISLGEGTGWMRHYMGYAGSKVLVNYKDEKKRSNTFSFKMPKVTETIDEFEEEGFRISPMWIRMHVPGALYNSQRVGWKYIIEKDDDEGRDGPTYDDMLKGGLGSQYANSQGDTKSGAWYNGKFYDFESYQKLMKSKASKGYQVL